MHVVEPGQLQERGSMHELDAAAGVRSAVPEQSAAYTICNT
jgi:hypothetical protein